jgi:hypothetical protein
MSLFDRVDIGIRPRQVLEGSDVNLYPFTPRGIKWMEQNIRQFTEPSWCQKERGLKLSNSDSTVRLIAIVRTLQADRLKIKFYGRLNDWNTRLPSLENGALPLPEQRLSRPRSISISAAIQILLLAEPMWRAVKLGDTRSVAGTSLFVLAAAFVVLLATVYRKNWARNLLAVLAIGGLASAVVSGDLSATNNLDRLLASATSIPNVIAVALLFTPASTAWFGNRGRYHTARSHGEPF